MVVMLPAGLGFWRFLFGVYLCHHCASFFFSPSNHRLSTLLSRSSFYLGPRTLSGSLETVLLPGTLRVSRLFFLKDLATVYKYGLPLPLSALAFEWANFPPSVALNLLDRRRDLVALSVAAAACLVKPTAAVTWLVVGVAEIFHRRAAPHLQRRWLACTAVVGVAALSCSLLLDRWFYSRWLCSWWNFIMFNFFTVSRLTEVFVELFFFFAVSARNTGAISFPFPCRMAPVILAPIHSIGTLRTRCLPFSVLSSFYGSGAWSTDVS